MNNSYTACWKCSKEVYTPEGRISFKSICEFCLSWQHACINCKFYKAGRANDCLVPNTEFVSDRELSNFCDEFKKNNNSSSSASFPTSSSVSKQLFGEEEKSLKKPENPEDHFKSLFKD